MEPVEETQCNKIVRHMTMIWHLKNVQIINGDLF